jgi:rRNA maturation endonuclease Nob1
MVSALLLSGGPVRKAEIEAVTGVINIGSINVDLLATSEMLQERDELKTHNVRCIGCGRFVAKRVKWNQCADCRDDLPML